MAHELEAQPGPLSLAPPDATTKRFWGGCAGGVLLFARCGACGAADFPVPVRCRWCQSTSLGWERSAGLGTVYSWTVVWRAPTPAWVTPYVPAIVDVDEGYRMLTNMVGLPVDDVAVGLRVQVRFHDAGDGVTLPYFGRLTD